MCTCSYATGDKKLCGVEVGEHELASKLSQREHTRRHEKGKGQRWLERLADTSCCFEVEGRRIQMLLLCLSKQGNERRGGRPMD